MRRILFVDDDPEVLDVLSELVPTLNPEWQTEFVSSGPAALEALARAPADVVVTDMVMPEMDGSELLMEVRRRHPQAVRIVFSGYGEQVDQLRSVELAHQYVFKPIEPAYLRQLLTRACALPDLMADERLKQVVSRMGSLPSLPTLYLRLQEACRDPEVSLRTIGDIIAQDPAMTAKILQMVNSAFFGLRSRVSSPLHAVQMLGQETVTALALSAHVFFGCDPLRLELCSMTSQWSHGMVVAAFANQVARLEGLEPAAAEDARVAGLLHDAGALVFAASLPGAYSAAVALARATPCSLSEAETEVMSVSHGAVGAYLLALWALPEAIVEAAAFHHQPSGCLSPGFNVLAAVHVADSLAHELYPEHVIGTPTLLDWPYLEELGLTERVSAWREACQALAEAEVGAGEA